MKRKFLFTAFITVLTLQGFAQESFNFKSGTISLEVRNDKMKCRLRNDNGGTECGCYIKSTKTFIHCSGKQTKVEDESKVIAAPDCCEKITLADGTIFQLKGTVKITDAMAT